jgi:hypothetical protein
MTIRSIAGRRDGRRFARAIGLPVQRTLVNWAGSRGLRVFAVWLVVAIFLPAGMAIAGNAAVAGTDLPVCGLWQGQVGQREVAVFLRPVVPVTAAGSLAGRYAYLHVGKPIPLAGTSQGSLLSLEEHGGPGGRPSGTWKLSPSSNGEGTMSGTWVAPDGKRTATIALVCMGDGAGQLRDPWSTTNLAGQTGDQQFEAFVRYPEAPDNSREGMEGTGVQHVALLATENSYDLVSRHPFAKAMSEVNAAIRSRVARAKKEERHCLAEGLRCEINAQSKIEFLSPRFATVSVSGYYDGGGAHPDEDSEIWVFEMTEGGAKRVNMERIYDLRTPSGRFKPAFWKLVGARPKGSDDHDLEDCAGQDDPIVQLGVSEGGILVDVSYSAHAFFACGYSAFIKTDQTTRFLRRDAPEVFRMGKF